MNKDLEQVASLPVVGRLLAETVGAWLALADAGNMLNTRFDASALDEQNDAIERVLAARRTSTASASAALSNLQAAA